MLAIEFSNGMRLLFDELRKNIRYYIKEKFKLTKMSSYNVLFY